MIEKLERYIREEDGVKISCPPDNVHIIHKINELVDAVNSIVSVQEKLIDSRFVVEPDKNNQLTLATLDHNKRLQDELDRTKKQLEIAVDALNEIDKNLITVVEMTWRAKMALEKINDIDKGEQQ